MGIPHGIDDMVTWLSCLHDFTYKMHRAMLKSGRNNSLDSWTIYSIFYDRFHILSYAYFENPILKIL
jgi:hypothetical protein